MTLLAMVAAAAAGGVGLATAAWSRVEAAGADAVEQRAAQRFLGRLLASARSVRLRDGTREPPVFFEGRAGGLEWIGRLPGRLAPPAEQIFSLGVRRAADGQALTLRWAPVGAARPELRGDAVEEVLVAGVEALRLRYFDGAARVWADAWPRSAALPALIELDIAYPEGDARSWTPVVARLGAAP